MKSAELKIRIGFGLFDKKSLCICKNEALYIVKDKHTKYLNNLSDSVIIVIENIRRPPQSAYLL